MCSPCSPTSPCSSRDSSPEPRLQSATRQSFDHMAQLIDWRLPKVSYRTLERVLEVLMAGSPVSSEANIGALDDRGDDGLVPWCPLEQDPSP